MTNINPPAFVLLSVGQCPPTLLPMGFGINNSTLGVVLKVGECDRRPQCGRDFGSPVTPLFFWLSLVFSTSAMLVAFA